MDLARIGVLLVAAGAGWLLAVPLTHWADHLLAGVAADEAAPVAYASAVTSGSAGDGAVGMALPLVLGTRWRWALRGGLAVMVPLALWRMLATPAFHPANVLTAMAFLVCIIAFTLIAVLDGAAHLIFVEIVAPPAAIVAVLGVVAGHTIWLPLLVGGVVGGVLFLGFYALGQWFYGTDALGFGDVELAVAFGVVLGWPLLLSGLILGMLLLAGTTGVLLALRRITTRTFMPIGAFLAVGALTTVLLVPPLWLA